MICYAIKNELGQYLGITTDCKYHYWTDVEYAHFFRCVEDHLGKQQVEDFMNTNYPEANCKVVKVEIREVEDE